MQASYHQARLQAEANEAMAKDGLIASLTLKLSQVTAEELTQVVQQVPAEVRASHQCSCLSAW